MSFLFGSGPLLLNDAEISLLTRYDIKEFHGSFNLVYTPYVLRATL